MTKEELEKKQTLFLDEYKKLAQKYGLDLKPVLNANETGIIPGFAIVEIEKKSPIITT